MRDKFSNKSRGFGFIIYTDYNSVERVLNSKNSHCLKGKWIDCKLATPKLDEKSCPNTSYNCKFNYYPDNHLEGQNQFYNNVPSLNKHINQKYVIQHNNSLCVQPIIYNNYNIMFMNKNNNNNSENDDQQNEYINKDNLTNIYLSNKKLQDQTEKYKSKYTDHSPIEIYNSNNYEEFCHNINNPNTNYFAYKFSNNNGESLRLDLNKEFVYPAVSNEKIELFKVNEDERRKYETEKIIETNSETDSIRENVKNDFFGPIITPPQSNNF